MSVIEDMMRSFESSAMSHSVFVHFVVAFGCLGVVPLILLAFTGFKSVNLRVVCVVWFLIASGGAGLAAGAGEEQFETLQTGSEPVLTGVEQGALKTHADLGEGGWMWPLIPAVLVLLTFGKNQKVRVGGGVLALVGALGVAGWAAYTGHTGGVLVYEHGLGVPARAVGPVGVDGEESSEDEPMEGAREDVEGSS